MLITHENDHSRGSKEAKFFPAKHRISRYYRPRMILHQQNLDYSKHCKYFISMFV
jgi:hypothetical protein